MSHADPLTLAAEIEKSAPVGITLTDRGNCLLIAAALRLAESTKVWYDTPSAGFESTEKRKAWTDLCRDVKAFRSARGGR